MKARESNIELLRIVLMAIIIVWHYLVYGESLLQNLTHTSYIYLAPLLTFPVDCFVFISGFYGLKLTRRKLISIIGMLVTYSVSIFFITSALKGFFDIKAFIISFFPVSTNYWWFFTQYILLLIISPILNLCDNFEKAFFRKILVLSVVFYLGIMSLFFGTKMGCIGDLPLFIFLYLTGKYLKRFPVQQLVSNRWMILITLYVLSCLLICVSKSDEQGILKIISYNNPIVVLMAIEVFYIFKQIKIGTIKLVNIVSSSVFVSYIVTESSLRMPYISLITNMGHGMVWYGMAAILTILIICPFEIIRKKFSVRFFDWISRLSYKIIC